MDTTNKNILMSVRVFAIEGLELLNNLNNNNNNNIINRDNRRSKNKLPASSLSVCPCRRQY